MDELRKAIKAKKVLHYSEKNIKKFIRDTTLEINEMLDAIEFYDSGKDQTHFLILKSVNWIEVQID